VLGGVLLLGMGSTASPLALSWADLPMSKGQDELAIKRYEIIIRSNPLLRKAALRRSARVWAVSFRQPAEARSQLARLIELESDLKVVASLWHEMGVLYQRDGLWHDAAQSYALAYRMRPVDPEASMRCVRAARAYQDAGEVALARQLWVEVANQWPEKEGISSLARGELLLAEGDAQGALGRYEEAVQLATNRHERAVAKLGVATCLERLGDLEQAIAAIDTSDLPAPVRERRVVRMQNSRR
jgi:tetratricopeptide (TPR) repeat protein